MSSPSNTSDTGAVVLSPVAALRPYVRQFVVVESSSPRDQLLLPDSGLAAPIRFRGTCALPDGSAAPRAALTGMRDAARVIRHGRGYGAIVAVFTETGAAAFTRTPLDRLFNATVPLDGVIGTAAELSLLEEQLAEATHHAGRAAIFERFLLGRLRHGAIDPLVAAAAGWIARADVAVRIDDLARRVGLSQSALERRFRKVVGATPKALASIVRLRRVTRLRAAGGNFTTIAHAAGYADQSHFIKDFKRFTGMAPDAFFRQSTFC
jgi:AraC-like DNA-binding protein